MFCFLHPPASIIMIIVREMDWNYGNWISKGKIRWYARSFFFLGLRHHRTRGSPFPFGECCLKWVFVGHFIYLICEMSQTYCVYTVSIVYPTLGTLNVKLRLLKVRCRIGESPSPRNKHHTFPETNRNAQITRSPIKIKDLDSPHILLLLSSNGSFLHLPYSISPSVHTLLQPFVPYPRRTPLPHYRPNRRPPASPFYSTNPAASEASSPPSKEQDQRVYVLSSFLSSASAL